MGTRADLYRDVLEHMGVVDADTPASAADTQVVAKRYATLHGTLVREKAVVWALASDDIPTRAVMPLVNLLSYQLARKFMQNPADYREDYLRALPDLRRQLAPAHIASRVRAEYF